LYACIVSQDFGSLESGLYPSASEKTGPPTVSATGFPLSMAYSKDLQINENRGILR
jgi:hypothetical protein